MIFFVQIFLFVSVVQTSPGDSSSWFQSCTQLCQQQRHCSDPNNDFVRSAPFYLVILGWDCVSECDYLCIINHTNYRREHKMDVLQYHGKWPFIRVFGIQELFSSIFSFANMIAPFVYFFRYRKLVDDDYYLKPHFLAFAVCSIVTWFFAVIFHMSDTKITEALDYYSADFLWSFICSWTVIRVFDVRTKMGIFYVYSFFGCIFLHLVIYLTFVKFDYAYNILVVSSLSATHLLLWLGWSILNWSKYQYTHKIVFSQTLAILAVSLELFDFPPIWDLIDSHALWHAATSVIGFIIWDWILQDSLMNSERLKKKL